MGGKISKRGSYNLQKREHKYKKKKGLTFDDRASSFISLPEAQVYEDDVNSPIPELSTKHKDSLSNHLTTKANENEDFPPKKISIAFNPTSSERDDYSSPDDEKIYENIFEDNDSETTKFGSPMSSSFDEQVGRRSSSQIANPMPVAVPRSRKTWSKENQGSEESFDRRERSSSKSSSQYDEIVQHQVGENWQELLSGRFWAGEVEYAQIERPKKVEEEQSGGNKHVINNKNNDLLQLQNSGDEVKHTSVTNNYSEEQSNDNDYGEDLTISTTAEQVPIAEIKNSSVINYLNQDNKYGKENAEDEQGQYEVQNDKMKQLLPQVSQTEEQLKSGRYKEDSPMNNHEEQVLIETSINTSTLNTNQNEERIHENYNQPLNKTEGKTFTNNKQEAHEVKANYEEQHKNEEQVLIMHTSNNEKKSSVSENVQATFQQNPDETKEDNFPDINEYEQGGNKTEDKIFLTNMEKDYEIKDNLEEQHKYEEQVLLLQTEDNKQKNIVSENTKATFEEKEDENRLEVQYHSVLFPDSHNVPLEGISKNPDQKVTVESEELSTAQNEATEEQQIIHNNSNQNSDEQTFPTHIPLAKSISQISDVYYELADNEVITESETEEQESFYDAEEDFEDIEYEFQLEVTDDAQIETIYDVESENIKTNRLTEADEQKGAECEVIERTINLETSDGGIIIKEDELVEATEKRMTVEEEEKAVDSVKFEAKLPTGAITVQNEDKTLEENAVNDEEENAILEKTQEECLERELKVVGYETSAQIEVNHPGEGPSSNEDCLFSLDEDQNKPTFSKSDNPNMDFEEYQSAVEQDFNSNVIFGDELTVIAPEELENVQTFVILNGDKVGTSDVPNEIKSISAVNRTPNEQQHQTDLQNTEDLSTMLIDLGDKTGSTTKNEEFSPSPKKIQEYDQTDVSKVGSANIVEAKCDGLPIGNDENKDLLDISESSSIPNDLLEVKSVLLTESEVCESSPINQPLVNVSVDKPNQSEFQDIKTTSNEQTMLSISESSQYLTQDFSEDTAMLVSDVAQNSMKELNGHKFEQIQPSIVNYESLTVDPHKSPVKDVPEDQKIMPNDPFQSHAPLQLQNSTNSVSPTAVLFESSAEVEHEELKVGPKKPTSLPVSSNNPGIKGQNSEEEIEEKLFEGSFPITTPEEIAQRQMKLWGKQDDEEVEEVITQINAIINSIDTAKNQIDNLGASERDKEIHGEMYQTLIRIMREVNTINNHNFNERVIELQHRALNEVHGCLKELQSKSNP